LDGSRRLAAESWLRFLWSDLTAPAQSEADLAFVRRNIDVYHYLLREGVAGRWSYMFHPRIVGDREHHYAQRTSHDRTKAMIILKHLASGNVIIYPKGLLPEHSYEVGYESHKGTAIRSGADLMANGIAVSNQVAGEMIYLGMPNRPGSGTDKTPPMPPSRVIARREVNIDTAEWESTGRQAATTTGSATTRSAGVKT